MADVEKKTQIARLLVAPPEMVFEELKAYRADVRRRRWTFDGDMEKALMARNEPLIDLGLATYGADREVVGAIHLKGKCPTDQTMDERYKKGLRLAVLGNETVAEVGFRSFPDDTIGAEEVVYVLAEADIDEAAMLLSNPAIDDEILRALYRGEEWAATVPDDRRRDLVNSSRLNERLSTNKDDDHGPDMRHWELHKAIFSMLETVPTSLHWIDTLTDLFNNLTPDQVRGPDSIDDVLARWKVDETGQQEAPKDDNYTETGLSHREEFRCLIGALYGKSYDSAGVVMHKTADNDDVARRCAFYGNGSLTVKAIKAGFERDGFVFVFAAILNDKVFLKKQLRKMFEEECLNGRHLHQYKRRCEQLQKRWKWFDPRPVAEWMVEDKLTFNDPLQEQVNELRDATKEIKALMKFLPWAIAAVAVIAVWK